MTIAAHAATIGTNLKRRDMAPPLSCPSRRPLTARPPSQPPIVGPCRGYLNGVRFSPGASLAAATRTDGNRHRYGWSVDRRVSVGDLASLVRSASAMDDLAADRVRLIVVEGDADAV